jgi:hypothetical protein
MCGDRGDFAQAYCVLSLATSAEFEGGVALNVAVVRGPAKLTICVPEIMKQELFIGASEFDSLLALRLAEPSSGARGAFPLPVRRPRPYQPPPARRSASRVLRQRRPDGPRPRHARARVRRRVRREDRALPGQRATAGAARARRSVRGRAPPQALRGHRGELWRGGHRGGGRRPPRGRPAAAGRRRRRAAVPVPVR